MAKRVFEGFADVSKALAIPPWPIHETMSTAEPGTINSCKFSSAILTSMTMSLLAPLYSAETINLHMCTQLV